VLTSCPSGANNELYAAELPNLAQSEGQKTLENGVGLLLLVVSKK
jgi:hypothetical protein